MQRELGKTQQILRENHLHSPLTARTTSSFVGTHFFQLRRTANIERSFKYGTGILYAATSSAPATSRLHNCYTLDQNRHTSG